MNKLKLLIENFLVYGLGSVIGKVIPFLMLPLITRLLPDTYYFGLNDLSTTIISFAQAIAILGMYDAMFRMFFDKADFNYKKEICSTTLFFTLLNSCLIFCVMIVFKKKLSVLFFNSDLYEQLIILCAFSVLLSSTNTIISAPTRMENKRKIYLFTNTLAPLLSYTLAIPLLLNDYYIMALPLAFLFSSIIIEIIFGVLNYKWFSLKSCNINYLKQMLRIAIPLVPNFLIYWIFNSSDRVMISKILGTEWNGIYAVGAKIGSISQLIYSAFAGGWQYFAFATMHDDEQINLISKIFEILGILTFSFGLIMCMCSKWLISVMFDERYISGHIIVPYLFIAPLLLMLYQIASSQFIIIKKTWPNIIVLGIGACTNLIINVILIPLLGIEGAALGTLCGYILSVSSIVVLLTSKKLIHLSKKFYMCSLVFILDLLIWRLLLINHTLLMFSLVLGTIILFIAIYILDAKKFVQQFWN